MCSPDDVSSDGPAEAKTSEPPPPPTETESSLVERVKTAESRFFDKSEPIALKETALREKEAQRAAKPPPPPSHRAGVAISGQIGGGLGAGLIGAGASASGGVTVTGGGVAPFGSLAGVHGVASDGGVVGGAVGAGVAGTVFFDEDRFHGEGREVGLDTPIGGVALGMTRNGEINSISLSKGPGSGFAVHDWLTVTTDR